MPINYLNDPNLITSSSWTTGSGSTGMFGQNGATVENERIYAVNPHGTSDVVWETRPSGDGGADGGWETSWFNIDRTKLYRFSVWVRRTSSTTGGTFYLGMYDNGTVQEIQTDETEGNPYWSCSNISWLTQNVWYLVVGHVFPSDTKHNINHPDTGYYTVSGGINNRGNIDFCNIAGDLRWSPTATQAVHRTYHYYCSDATSRLQFWQPRVDVIDGTEPSVRDLLENKLYRTISTSTGRHPRLTGLSRDTAAPDPVYLYKQGINTNGMYWLNPGGLGVQKFYIDFTYRPGVPLTMVIANRRGTGGIDRATRARCTGPWVTAYGNYDDSRNFNLWVGLDYWRYLGDTVVQGVKGNQATYSSGTHNVTLGNMDLLAKWKFAGWSSNYGFKYPRDYANLIGSTTSGWYSYHAVNEYGLTTYDYDTDANSGNCATYYDNNPWWYGSCWSGNYFGGGGYQDAPYWDGSGTLYYAYGAAYLGWYDATFDTI